MTKKLYWENPYIKAFDARVISVEIYKEDPSKYLVTLDQTAFYPEGGGQPWDEGHINTARVSYVFEENDQIYHVVDCAPEINTQVSCQLDWDRRFDFMQQHLGQHILSSVIETLHNADTVGFHLGNDVVTIDIAKENLTAEEQAAIEDLANQYIYRDLPIHVHYPDQHMLQSFSLRKQPSVTDGVRIVEIDQLDYSPCGGTHPNRTGEVGILKIRRLDKMRGNIRIEFLCGKRALMDYSWKNSFINDIANRLSIKDTEVLSFFDKLHKDYRQLEKENRSLHKNLLDYQIKALYDEAPLHKGCKIIVQVYEGFDFKSLQYMASAISRYENAIALLSAKNDKAQVVFTRSQQLNIDISKLFKEVIGLINGKGGGNAVTAQGGGEDLSNLESMLEAARIKLINEYIK